MSPFLPLSMVRMCMGKSFFFFLNCKPDTGIIIYLLVIIPMEYFLSVAQILQ